LKKCHIFVIFAIVVKFFCKFVVALKKIGLLTGLFFLLMCGTYAARPTVQASSLSYNNLQCNAVTLNWVAGNGAARIVVGRKGSAPDFVPSDNSVYNANAIFGSGTPLGAANDNFVVYNANGFNFVNVTGLQPGQIYYFHIYEHDNANTSTQYLISNPAVEVSFTTYNITLDFSIKVIDSCQVSNSFEFTNTSTSSIPGLTYLFDFGDGTSTSSPVTHRFTGNGGYKDIRIIPQTSITGCPNTFKRTVKVFPRKVAFIDFKTFNDSQCLEDNYFEVSATGLLNPFPIGITYYWKFGDGTESFFAKMKKRYKVAGTFNVMLELVSNSNSQPTACKDTIMFPLTVLPSPVGSLEISDTFQCLKHNKFDFTNPDNTLSYFRWYFGDNDSSSNQNVSHVYKNVGNYKVMHVAFANTGCKGRDTVDITVLPNLDSRFTGLDSFYCQNNQQVKLTPNSIGGTFTGYPVNAEILIPNGPAGQYTMTHIVNDKYCADTTIIPFNIYSTPKPNIGRDTPICSVSSYQLDANVVGQSYNWNTGQTTKAITVFQGGAYNVTVTDGKCSGSDTINVVFSSAPRINIGSDTLLCKGGGLFLKASYPKSTYLWNTGSTDSMIYAFQPGKYQVTVTNPCGVTTDSLFLFYQSDYCDLFMANSFSPGNDLVNNYFRPRGINITVTLFQIYNRWGELIFETDKDTPQDSDGWDGTYKGEYVPEGLYLWKLNYTTPNGPYIKKNNASGQIILIR
jgi:gliding motility-associated-like protein